MTEQEMILSNLVARRQDLKARIDEINKTIDNDINPAIGVAMALMNLDTTEISANGKQWTVILSTGQKKSLVALKLAAAGVTDEQLQAGTKWGKKYSSVTVREKGKSAGNSDGGDDNNGIE